MLKLPTLCVLALTAGLAAQADTIRFARYPHQSHGKLAFCYHGDIWIAEADGSSPRKLTHHIANDKSPRFSPDGTRIAFTSDRMGNDDVFVIPIDGGEPRQITFHTTGDTALYWTPDGERVLISTNRGARAFGSPLHTVSADGDLPVPLPMDQGASGMISSDGTKIAFNRYGFRYWRKGYRGNSNTNVYVQDLSTREIRQLTDTDIEEFRGHTQDAHPMWGADGKIYFMSERDGKFNLWRISPAGGEPEQVTDHDDDGVQYPSMSPDGKVIVYENAFRLWRIAVPDGTPEAIELELGFDPKANLVSYLRSDSEADGFAPSPDGDYVAVDYHGELFVVPTDPKIGEKKQITSSAWRDRNAVYAPDGSALAYISDESGDEEIWLHTFATGEKRQLTTHRSLKRRPIWSPDSKTLAYVAANRLFTVDVATGRNTELGYNEDGGYSLTEFSPDGGWLSYSRRDPDLNTDVYLKEIASGRELNITQNPFRDGGGRFTPDGKHVVFTSSRDGGTNHLFVIALARQTEDPNDPLVREREHRAKQAKKKRERDRDEGEDKPAAAAIVVDLDGIDRRAVQLTRGDNGVSSVSLSEDGKKIYFVSSDDKGRGLFSIGIDGEDRKKVTDGSFSGLSWTADKDTVFYGQGGKVYRMPIGSKKKTAVAFAVTVRVDRRAEWRQLFDESWRIMKYRFYDENMHGVDWPAMRERYLPLLAYCGQNQDVYDLTNEMIGELNASHTGVRGPRSVQAPTTYTTRQLGVELEPHRGHFRVSHVYRDGPADKEWIDVNQGDYVLAIDGHAIEGTDNYWKVLNHALNDYVTLDVAGAPDGEVRKVRVRTVTSLRNIKYEEWVHDNREYVEKISDGKIAYVHIRSMNRSSLAKFENEINRFWNAKGIVIDIRYNGGGNIDQQLLDILERRPYEYWNSRWGGRNQGRRPRQAIAGPKVMLINRRSGSDSEVTPMGFRDLGLGRIVGNPTAAAVIATGSYRLINGGSIRTPGSLVVTYDPTKPNNFGINLENYGVAPDVFVVNTPEEEIRGDDRELRTAVQEALRMLEQGTWQYQRGQK